MTRVYADQIGSLCDPDERARAIGGVMYHPGAERVGGRPDPRWRDVSVDLHGIVHDRLELEAERMVGGESLRGFSGSGADALRRAVDQASTMAALLVTDRRLMVVRVAEAPRVFWAAPRGVVVALRHRRHWLQHGRLEVDFADGSMVRLMAGLVLARRAKRLARAWEDPGASIRS